MRPGLRCGDALVEVLARDGALQECVPLVRVVPAEQAAPVGGSGVLRIHDRVRATVEARRKRGLVLAAPVAHEEVDAVVDVAVERVGALAPDGGREERAIVDHDLSPVRRGNAAVRHALCRDAHGHRRRAVPLVDRMQIDLVRRRELETCQDALVLDQAVSARLCPDRRRVEAVCSLRLRRHVRLPGEPRARRRDCDGLRVGDLERLERRGGCDRGRATVDRHDYGGTGGHRVRGLSRPGGGDPDLCVRGLLGRHTRERTNARRDVGDRRCSDRAVQSGHAHELGRSEVGWLGARCKCGCRRSGGPAGSRGRSRSRRALSAQG